MASTFCHNKYTITVLHARAQRLFQNIYENILPYNHDPYVCIVTTYPYKDSDGENNIKQTTPSPLY